VTEIITSFSETGSRKINQSFTFECNNLTANYLHITEEHQKLPEVIEGVNEILRTPFKDFELDDYKRSVEDFSRFSIAIERFYISF